MSLETQRNVTIMGWLVHVPFISMSVWMRGRDKESIGCFEAVFTYHLILRRSVKREFSADSTE